ncbi:hypothetical protein C8F04DRAFT_1200769 [Mycena alexandri]|uniref:Uncharacterized protein n=1 Tax=Mycena alexandri TaxID=1745969 RepID=A0AAD6WMZ7_9AGAR|nr:hypothetical protein C8F04DRAFT_1200769 [Mycena alexandri]
MFRFTVERKLERLPRPITKSFICALNLRFSSLKITAINSDVASVTTQADPGDARARAKVVCGLNRSRRTEMPMAEGSSGRQQCAGRVWSERIRDPFTALRGSVSTGCADPRRRTLADLGVGTLCRPVSTYWNLLLPAPTSPGRTSEARSALKDVGKLERPMLTSATIASHIGGVQQSTAASTGSLVQRGAKESEGQSSHAVGRRQPAPTGTLNAVIGYLLNGV